jgi:hypothetical protein
VFLSEFLKSEQMYFSIPDSILTVHYSELMVTT